MGRSSGKEMFKIDKMIQHGTELLEIHKVMVLVEVARVLIVAAMDVVVVVENCCF